MELFLCAPGRALRRVRDFSPEWLFAVHCGTGQSQEPADFQSADRCSNPTAWERFTGQDRCVAREDGTARRAAARVGRRTDVQARARAGHRAVSDLCLSMDAASTAAFPLDVSAGSCALRTRMRAAQQQEQQRRLNGIDTRIEHLQLLDDLERACLDHFPEYPTQWLGNSAVMIAAFRKIRQESCQALAEKARQTPPAALQAARAQAQSPLLNASSTPSPSDMRRPADLQPPRKAAAPKAQR